jgi:hypothetical protein
MQSMNLVKPLFIFITIATFQVAAETAYRSVDEQGNVTFSDRPVSSATQEERVSIDVPAPSPEQQQEALQREEALQKAASQPVTPVTPAKASHNKAAARQAVEDAEARLGKAIMVREGDRIGTAGGGSRLKPEYHERVRAAEAELEAAKKQLE